jgi:hypothetical protein
MMRSLVRSVGGLVLLDLRIFVDQVELREVVLGPLSRWCLTIKLDGLEHCLQCLVVLGFDSLTSGGGGELYGVW